MSNIRTYHVIGLMSGSSLDGLDICYVEFLVHSTQSFSYKIIQADCVEYTDVFRVRLRNAQQLSAFEYAQLHTQLGTYFGKLTHEFIQKYKIESVDLVCSHGQTIFHQPAAGFTAQLGCGAQIAAHTDCKVVCDLRTADIAHQGQGAPLVPIAEKYLFPDYKVFLNIGGIANISFHNPKSLKGLTDFEEIIAYDICAANTLLNHLAQQKNLPYDKDGDLSRKGTVIPALLDKLNALNFCTQAPPKSLGSEHVYNSWISLVDSYQERIEDKLSTAAEHIAVQVGHSIRLFAKQQHLPSDAQLFITGGGAMNTYLTERINAHSPLAIVIPDTLTVHYKEALAIAFLGLCRILEIPNSLSSVTGANKDAIGGAVYLP